MITGRSAHPTLLVIEDETVRFDDASDLLGLGTSKTEQTVRDKLGRRFRVACIGPAGENGVSFASIANDGGRQAGRTGTGAVMGSKNLKAIAVRGRNPAPVFDREQLDLVGRDLSARSLGPATEKYRTTGTMANIAVFDRLGALPTRNFQQSTFEFSGEISGETLHRPTLSRTPTAQLHHRLRKDTDDRQRGQPIDRAHGVRERIRAWPACRRLRSRRGDQGVALLR